MCVQLWCGEEVRTVSLKLLTKENIWDGRWSVFHLPSPSLTTRSKIKLALQFLIFIVMHFSHSVQSHIRRLLSSIVYWRLDICHLLQTNIFFISWNIFYRWRHQSVISVNNGVVCPLSHGWSGSPGAVRAVMLPFIHVISNTKNIWSARKYLNCNVFAVVNLFNYSCRIKRAVVVNCRTCNEELIGGDGGYPVWVLATPQPQSPHH